MTALVPPFTSYNALCANDAPMKTGIAHLEMVLSTFGAAMAEDSNRMGGRGGVGRGQKDQQRVFGGSGRDRGRTFGTSSSPQPDLELGLALLLHYISRQVNRRLRTGAPSDLQTSFFLSDSSFFYTCTTD